ncbi:ABC transporter ATP-binding protein [Thiorhodospira sibirica]|uniref:ABC transporter ATP-binding protein n=1 Tax=Thiorhodospira sibirica TaxID=154347 RepID=UPI00022C11C5|nr:ABC transporter ATP-binding protein [Thiorhodospira sibirica]
MTCALALRKLTKTYNHSLHALKGIDLEVQAGDFFALLGPNGAGKSTAIGIIASLINKSAGQVLIFGHDLDHELNAAKRCIGLVPQEFNFNNFEPVLEIVVNSGGYHGIPYKEACRRAEKYLKQLDLWERRKDIARNLSGGMKRRLMIARALVHEPQLLILDEPTAGVDIEIRRSMWDFLRTINREGRTIILTTHYLEEAENLCRNIAIIDHGEIIENTHMKGLLSKLSMETFVLDLARPLHEELSLPGHTLRRIDDMTLEVDIAKQTGLNQLFIDLTQKGVQVLSLRNKTNRLEQLFMNMVEESRAA